MLVKSDSFSTPWTVACQAPLSMGFSKQEYWSGLPLPSPGDLPDSGTEPTPLKSPALADRLFSTSATWESSETLPHGCPQALRPALYVSREPVSPLPSIPCLRRKELRHQRRQNSGRGFAGRGVQGTHGSGQRSTWSLVSEGKMQFWLLRTMSSFRALLVSAL